ncbi:MAG: hypothetical protein ACO2O2_00920 [Acidilobaceae archaeon]
MSFSSRVVHKPSILHLLGYALRAGSREGHHPQVIVTYQELDGIEEL